MSSTSLSTTPGRLGQTHLIGQGGHVTDFSVVVVVVLVTVSKNNDQNKEKKYYVFQKINK